MYANVATLRQIDTAELVSIANRETLTYDHAWLTPDPERLDWVRVQWLSSADEPYRPAACDCWAWTESGVLWLPSDGQSNRQRDWGDDQPNRLDNWYDPKTGLPAVFGIPGTTMYRLL